MKKILAVFLTVAITVALAGCTLPVNIFDGNKDLETFYNKVSESHELLDAVADDIYSNWHGAVYDEEFGEDINLAILSAQIDHEEDLARIEELDGEIATLFKKVKDGKQGDLVKSVMSAYSDYYEFVVNVSGSFNSFSAAKETLKKELASSLKELSFEL